MERSFNVANMIQVALKATAVKGDIPNVYRLRDWCLEEYGFFHAPTTQEIDEYLRLLVCVSYTGGKNSEHPRARELAHVDLFIQDKCINDPSYPVTSIEFVNHFFCQIGKEEE